uniref:G protein-coupled receptor n=1 Tax=Steinernema glaseri TaxID=37863 RepID=A0A1I8AV58_9BILA
MDAQPDFRSLPFAIVMFLQETRYDFGYSSLEFVSLFPGGLGLLINVLLIVSIVTSPSNRVRKQYTAAVGVFLAEAFLSVSFFVLSIQWIVQLFTEYVPVKNRETFQCLTVPHNMMFAVSYQSVGVTALLIGVDRFLSELFPKIYSKLSIVDISIAIVVCFLVSLVPLMAAINFSRAARIDFYSNRPYLCMALDSISDTVSPFFVLFRLVTVSVSLCLALPVLFHERRKGQNSFSFFGELLSALQDVEKLHRGYETGTISFAQSYRNPGFAILTSISLLIIPDAVTVVREFRHNDSILFFYLLNQLRSWLNASAYLAKHGNLRRQLAELFFLVKV